VPWLLLIATTYSWHWQQTVKLSSTSMRICGHILLKQFRMSWPNLQRSGDWLFWQTSRSKSMKWLKSILSPKLSTPSSPMISPHLFPRRESSSCSSFRAFFSSLSFLIIKMHFIGLKRYWSSCWATRTSTQEITRSSYSTVYMMGPTGNKKLRSGPSSDP